MYEDARKRGANSEEIKPSESVALSRDEILMQVERQAKSPEQVSRPIPGEKADEMEEDEEEPEDEESEEEETGGTRAAPIVVVAEVVAPTEVPKPVGGKEKVRAEELTTRPLPRSGDEFATPIGQWESGPPKDKQGVVVDEGQARVIFEGV